MTSFIRITINKNKEIFCESSTLVKTFNNVDVYLIGQFFNQNGCRSTEEDIYMDFIKNGTKLYDTLDGTGTVIIIDHNENKLYVFTDYFNSIVPLFYSITKNELLLSTDLLFITKKLKNPCISNKSAHQFMLHGMIFGKNTLIKQVKKLPAKHFLEVDIKKFKLHIRKCSYTIPKISDVTSSVYNEAFKKCMKECYESEAGMTLSGGFDTNFILHFLQEIKKEKNDMKTITAFCGGGKTGKDETPLAKEIADYYKNIDLKSFYIGKESIQNYPEIIYALQGVCFEDGVFLHYHMAKLFKENNIKYVYTGDLADQVLNSEIYKYTKKTFKKILKMNFYGLKNAILFRRYDFYKWLFRGRYETAALKLLKKSGQLWDYFGVLGIYPYARRHILSIAKSTAISGDYKKRFHRKVVLETVDSEIAKKIKRNGGNTDPMALFDDKTKSSLRAIIKKFPWYKKRTYVNENQQLGYELRILYVDLVRRIFLNKDFKRSETNSFPLLQDFYPEFKN